MEWAASLEDLEVGKDGLDVSTYGCEPDFFFVAVARARLPNSCFHINGSPESFRIGDFSQHQIVSNRASPHPAARSRSDAAPP